jgi:hypothetical protein
VPTSLLASDDGQIFKNRIHLNYIKESTIYVKATGLNRPSLEHRLTAMETISITPPASATVGQSMQRQSRVKLKRGLGLMLLFILAFSFNSCKKDAETFKMAGTWELESYVENGVDRTAYFK